MVRRRETSRTGGRGTRESSARKYDRRVANLVRSNPDGNDLEVLSRRVTELESRLYERDAEIDRVKADLAAFRIRYRQDVGLLHEELDDLERAIAEAELGELSKLIADGGRDTRASSADARRETAPRFTSDAIRKLFRDVAKTIHPDLSSDQQARDRRHALMVEANRAYAVGDEERLRSILEVWAKSPEAVQGSDPDAMRQRLVRRIAESEEQLSRLDEKFAEMRASPLWQLKQMVDEAAAGGKDLIEDMVRRLKRDITAARNRLDAMLWNS